MAKGHRASRDFVQIVAPSFAKAAGSTRQVVAVDDLWQLVTSRRPEHINLKTDLVGLMRTAQSIAEDLDAAMHPDVAGENFWGSFAGEFAAFSVGPLLATCRAIEAATALAPVKLAHMVENARDPAWWSGKSHFAPVACDVLRRAGGTRCTQSPGNLLRTVRRLVSAPAAHFQGHREMMTELAAIAEGTTSAAHVTPCDVLFLGLGATSAPIVGAVWPQLVAEYGLSCAVLDFHYQDFATPFSCFNLPRNDIGQFIRPEDIAAVRKIGRRWPTWSRHFSAHAGEVASFAALSPTMQQAIDERVRMSFARHAPLWMLWRIAGYRALEAFDPDAIVQFQIYPINAVPTVRHAIQNGVDAIMLQHGVIGDWIYTSPTLQLSEVVVWGSHSGDIHRTVLGKEVTITETGNGLYDGVERRNVDLPEDVSALRGKHRAMFVLATQFNEHDFYDGFEDWWLNQVAKACSQLDAALILKLHPADTNQFLYQQLADGYPGTVIIAEHGRYALSDLIAASDAMITRDSTVVFEAGLLGIPAITINLTDHDDWFPYADLGGAIGIHMADEILPALRQVIEDECFRIRLKQRRKEFLSAQIGPTDGHATARIAARIAAHVH